MKILLTVILFVSAGLSYCAEPISDDVRHQYPQLFREYVKYSYQITLPPGMLKALEKYDPAFKILKMEDFAEELRILTQASAMAFSERSCYSAVFGDFNGDGLLDAAVLGRTQKIKGTDLLLVILAEGNEDYKVVEAARFGAANHETMSIALSSPGETPTACGGEPVNLKNHGILINNGVGSSVLYWDTQHKNFQEIATGGC